MASKSKKRKQDADTTSGRVHLPDCSEELAAAADLEVVEGVPLKLHSQVLASGSRVLRHALCGCADASSTASPAAAASRAAAVLRAFDGFGLADVQIFLKLLYDPSLLEASEPHVGESPNAWQNLLMLGDKLDAPSAIEASRKYPVLLSHTGNS